MRVFRLCKREYSSGVLSGEGGLHADGRWHSAGRRIVYCASSESLAVLEVRVHVGRFIPRAAFDMHVIEIPDRLVRHAAIQQLPRDWNVVPNSNSSQKFGDRWLAGGASCALRVPSVHSQSDFTVLFNPAHSAAGRVIVVETRPYSFDRRLF